MSKFITVELVQKMQIKIIVLNYDYRKLGAYPCLIYLIIMILANNKRYKQWIQINLVLLITGSTCLLKRSRFSLITETFYVCCGMY